MDSFNSDCEEVIYNSPKIWIHNMYAISELSKLDKFSRDYKTCIWCYITDWLVSILTHQHIDMYKFKNVISTFHKDITTVLSGMSLIRSAYLFWWLLWNNSHSKSNKKYWNQWYLSTFESTYKSLLKNWCRVHLLSLPKFEWAEHIFTSVSKWLISKSYTTSNMIKGVTNKDKVIYDINPEILKNIMLNEKWSMKCI